MGQWKMISGEILLSAFEKQPIVSASCGIQRAPRVNRDVDTKKMKMARTPEKVSSPVRRLCKRIHPTAEALYIPISPAVEGLTGECFANVEVKINKDGGSLQYGWAVWYLPSVYMEAEFHAVWKSPAGELIDVTPPKPGITKMLFIPDPKRCYIGKQVDNIRIPLSKSPQVKEFIRLAEQRFHLMNEGDLAYQSGPVLVNARQLDSIDIQMCALAGEIGIR